ncbi:uncharacterized protein ACJ7VT_015359 [Polymixia lowei]
MASALLRGGTGLCLKCINREVCRFVGRQQTALLCSKPSDPRTFTKQPRRTHIKKGKPQPVLDVAKLLEQLFSQRRQTTAPPSASAVKASSKPALQPQSSTMSPATSTSSISTSSQTRRAVSVSPATFIPGVDVSTKTTPPFKTTPLSPPPITESVSLNSASLLTPKPPSGISTETSPTCTAVTGASPIAEVFDTTPPTSRTSNPPPNITPPTSESPAASIEPAKTIEARVKTSTGPVELTTAPAPYTTSEPVESTVKTFEFTAEPLVERNPASTSTKVENIIKSKADTKPSAVETLECNADFAEPTVELTVEPRVEPTVEPTVEPRVDMGLAAIETSSLSHAASTEHTIDSTTMSVKTKEEPALESSILSSGTDVGRREERAVEEVSIEEAPEEGQSVAEVMTLESVTPAEVKFLPTDALIQTKSALDHEAETLVQDTLVQTGNRHKFKTIAQTETLTEVLSERDSLSEEVEALEAETDILMKELLCSVPEVVSTMAASVTPSSALHTTAPGPHDSPRVNWVQSEEQRGGAEEARVEEERGEAEATVVDVTLESVTLAEVSAAVGSLETDVLKETKAEILTVDSLSEATDVLEAQMSVVLEAQTSVVLEAQTCSDLGPITLPQQSFPEQREAGSRNTATEDRDVLIGRREVAGKEKSIGQEAVRESVIGGEERGEEEGSVVEAMSLESVTLAEVEAIVGTLENTALTETTVQLEKEADIVAKEERREEEKISIVSEEKKETEVLSVESLSLSEADSLFEDLQAETDVLMEELLFSVPGRVVIVTEDLIGQEVVREDGEVVSDAVVSGEESGSEGTLGKERGEEEAIVNKALTLESITMSEIKALVETETSTQLETGEAGRPVGNTHVEGESTQIEFSEGVETDTLSGSEIVTRAEVLVEAAEALDAVILRDLLCSVPGPLTMTTVTMGTASHRRGDSATPDPDTLLPPPPPPPLPPPLHVVPRTALKEVLGPSQEEGAGPPPAAPAGRGEEVDEDGETDGETQTEAVGILEGLDPVQRLFLEKIREYNNKSRMCEGIVEAGPDYEKHLSEETARLQRLYGGGDLDSFPVLTFTEPKLDQDS